MYRKTRLVCWSFRTSRWCKNNTLTCRYCTTHNHFTCALMKPPADILHPTWQRSLGEADIHTSEMVCGSLMLPIVIIATLLTRDETDDVAEGKHHRSHKLDDNLQATAGLIRGRCVSRARREEREWCRRERGEGILYIHTISHTCIFWNTNNCLAMSLPPACLLTYDASPPNDTVCLCSVFVCEGFQEAGVSDNGKVCVFFVVFSWGGAAPSGESMPLPITCTSD